jgi:hypothetical protein
MSNVNENHPKIFLFCIGGTGARVLKALTFLLASGADLKASKVIPIIIDPDNANGDVQRTIEVLKNYQSIRRRLEFSHNGFFKTDIQTLASLEAADEKSTGLRISDSFRFDIDGTRDGVFQNFIGYDTMSLENRAMTELLFSERNLTSELSVGFKGNPHMGSIVLNQFKDSLEFKFFASRLGEKDRVFIVSSIFGGTGAAGFPLLVKNIREAKDPTPNPDRLQNVPMGALTVAPYFGVEPDDTIAIDKSTFIAKTKAALEYYADNLSGNNSLNSLYYIGDQTTRDYKAAEGRAQQTNDAHVIELLSALAIFDFMEIPANQLVCTRGKADESFYKEYGIRGDVSTIGLQNLGVRSKGFILESMTQYVMSMNFWKNTLSNAINKPENWVRSKKVPIKGDFLLTDFYNQQLLRFNQRFQEWMGEMARNTRGFDPYNTDTPLLHNIIKGFTPKKKTLFSGEKPDEWGYEDYNHELNTQDANLPAMEVEQRFMALFYQATKQLFAKRFTALRA